MNRYILQKTWSKLTLIRATNEEIKLTHNEILNDTVFAVYCLIAFKPDTTITIIVNHPYFANISLSTIKRAIGTLLNEKLITITTGNDKRERLLNIIFELN